MSLNCVYCEKLVFGNGGVTVANKGPAHQNCYQANQAMSRTFHGIEISELLDEDLNDLKELVLGEANDRARKANGLELEDEIELF